MQFLFLLLLNICMWALFYLIISLKLEKSASHFREQKLRSEMDEITKEFNAVAERNISMLETRIAVIKRLLERSGDIKSVDLVLGEEDKPGTVTADVETEKQSVVREQAEYPEEQLSSEIKDFFKKGLILSFSGIKTFIRGFSGQVKTFPASSADGIQTSETTEKVKKNSDSESDAGLLEATLLPPVPGLENESADDDSWESLPGDKEIQKLFAACDNKYNLVEDLYRKGCSIETLSRHSGIPAGEVKLVLNLSRSV